MSALKTVCKRKISVILGVFPLHQIADVEVSERMGLKLQCIWP